MSPSSLRLRYASKNSSNPSSGPYVASESIETFGGGLGVNRVLAEFLDSVFDTGVKFCCDHGYECSAAFEENEWVWSRMSKMQPVYLCEKDESELLILAQSAAA
jgi:hypothetical protein